MSIMGQAPGDGYSVHFAHYAGMLERHLRKNGISCREADLIIEESSELYFEKLRSAGSKLSKLFRKQDPERLFAESAAKAIERHLPEVKDTFGCYSEIAKCIK